MYPDDQDDSVVSTDDVLDDVEGEEEMNEPDMEKLDGDDDYEAEAA